MNFLKSKRARVAAIIGAGLGIAGIALAAFLFTSTISGALGTSNGTADYSVDATASGAQGGMVCNADGNGRDVIVNPTVKQYTAVNAQSGGAAQVPAQECTITMTVTNTGTQALQPTGFAVNGAGPIQVQPQAAPGAINGGQSADYVVKLVVPQGTTPVTGGPITGQLTFTSVD